MTPQRPRHKTTCTRTQEETSDHALHHILSSAHTRTPAQPHVVTRQTLSAQHGTCKHKESRESRHSTCAAVSIKTSVLCAWPHVPPLCPSSRTPPSLRDDVRGCAHFPLCPSSTSFSGSTSPSFSPSLFRGGGFFSRVLERLLLPWLTAPVWVGHRRPLHHTCDESDVLQRSRSSS